MSQTRNSSKHQQHGKYDYALVTILIVSNSWNGIRIICTCISGGGSMVGALSGSTQREPLVVGKPSTFMMDYLANE